MIGYRPHPSLLGGSGGGSGGAGVDQTARDAVAASDAVNVTQANEIGALKAADTAFEARVAAGETKDAAQDTDLASLHTADTTLAGRATALESRATSGEAKDTSQDASLTAHGTRLTSAEGKNSSQDTEIAGLHTADTTLAGRASALEGRATSGETKDVSQDAEIATLRTQIGKTPAATNVVWLGSYRVKASDPKSNFDVMSKAPAGSTEFEIVAVGGGSSGVCCANATNVGNANGGMPGCVKRSGRLPLVADTKIDMVIGAGGAPASRTTNGNSQNPGSPTSVIVKNAGGSTVYAFRANGGGTYWQVESVNAVMSVPVNIHVVGTLASFVGNAHGGLPGKAPAGSTSVSKYDPSGDIWDGRLATDGPAGGGAAIERSSDMMQYRAGHGGEVQYTRRPEWPGFWRTAGGVAGSIGDGTNTFNENPAPGENPSPDLANTFGSGGGGTLRGTSSTQQPGGKGGYPGGGGGGAYSPIQSNGSVTITSGGGGDGCVDLNFYGVPPQAT